MAVQVSYPGVYIEEFAPGAPIQGVGTNTAAFIGVAASGPIGVPTPIQSWDAFRATFGGFISDGPAGYLAPAVFGFFLNGGTTCYVVRVATARRASVGLKDRGNAPQTVFTARALVEGPAGNALTVQVADSSRLAAALARANVNATTLAAAYAETTATALDAGRTSLTVASNVGFAPGDAVHLENGNDRAEATVAGLSGAGVITLAAPLPAGNFAAGTVRTADLRAGARSFRVVVPGGLSLARDLLPRGTLVRIAQGNAAETATVASSSGDAVTLERGLTNTFSYADKTKLPAFGSLEFDLTIGAPASTFKFLSMNRAHPGYWGDAVASPLAELVAPDEPPPLAGPDRRPAAGSFPLAGGAEDDRVAARADLLNDPTRFLDLLKPIGEISLVAVPGETDKGVQQAVISHCEDMLFRFGVLDPIRNVEQPVGILEQLGGLASERGYAALYYPWIAATNPATGASEYWPPSGHMAGIIARTDAQLGVFKAPANTNVRGALGLERRLTDQQHGLLNPKGVNVLRVFPGEGAPLVWGARTIASDRNWQYVNIRRLFIFLEQSIQEGIRWAVFQPNTPALWQKLKRTIHEFLERVWRDGGLFGATAKDAFYVRIDEALNPEADRKLGRLTIEIGVQPAYPAEFIVVRIGIWDGGASINEG